MGDTESAGNDVGSEIGFDDLGTYIPEGCDLFPDYGAPQIRKKIEEGNDPRVRWVRLARNLDGKQQPIDGMWPAEACSRAWLQEKHGAGWYIIHGLDLNNRWVTKAVHRVEWPSGTAPVAPAAPVAGGLVSGSPVMDRILETLLMRAINPPAPPADPMREAVASLVSLMGVQIQAMSASKPSNEPDPMTMKLLELVLARDKAPQRAAATAPAGSVQEMLGLLQFGMKLRDQVAGASNGKGGDDKGAEWVELVTSTVDSIGPGLVATLAQAILPGDKASSVVQIIEEHMRARAEEARATPITTEGIPVG